VFALFHENFVRWNYPSPSAMRRRWIRLSTIALFCLLPMKMELSTARLIMQGQAIPSLRKGRVGFALRAPLFLLKRRLRMMSLIAAQAHTRRSGYQGLLKPL
jgi:hypothetical protein